MTGRHDWKPNRSIRFAFYAIIGLFAAAVQPSAAQDYNWTFLAGSSTPSPAWTYPTHPGQTGYPRGRFQTAYCSDDFGNLWMFGGRGANEGATLGVRLADLWKFDSVTKEWRWISGSEIANTNPVYPSQLGQTGTPGARWGGALWHDRVGNLWLFGGSGFASDGIGELNDLWKYNIATNKWTYEGGSQVRQDAGVYAGTAQPGTPAARHGAATGITLEGDLLLFGGSYGSVYLNDMWKLSTSSPPTWRLQGGSNVDENGNYPVTPGGTGYPGGRMYPASFVDSDYNMWIYGGHGHGAQNTGRLSDLWHYRPATNDFVHISGSSNAGVPIAYPANYNVAGQPGGRSMPLYWSSGEQFWFGGGFASYDGNTGRFNDLWSFKLDDNHLRYFDGPMGGTEGVFPITPQGKGLPPGRSGGICWIVDDTLYLFGGSPNGTNTLNDMWSHPGYVNSSVDFWSLYE